MSVEVLHDAQGCRLVFHGRMIREHLTEFEVGIIDAMRRYPRLKVDLSGIQEIDPCGIRLLHSMRRLGGAGIDFITPPPSVEQGPVRPLNS